MCLLLIPVVSSHLVFMSIGKTFCIVFVGGELWWRGMKFRSENIQVRILVYLVVVETRIELGFKFDKYGLSARSS